MPAWMTSLFLALVLLTGEATYPSGAQGWTAMATNAAFYCFAVIGMFASVAALGPMRAAMFLNLEPVVTLAMGRGTTSGARIG